MRDAPHQITELKLPAREEYIVVAKRAAGALGSVVGFSVAEIDDLNIAITQACENAVAAATELWGEGNGQLKLTFKGLRGKLEVNITSTPPRPVEVQPAPAPAVRTVRRLRPEAALDYEGIGLNMIRLFVDELRYQVDDQGCMRMRMVKYLID
jgi:anti-sigma regulatory factor (Ser/Thr protein kinase)